MCGISAISLKKGLDAQQKSKVLLKLKILGIYNDSRGGHGCGLYINQSIYKGHNDNKEDTKLFKDFISQKEWKIPEINDKCSVIIAHARKSTFGSHKAENNHPFYIETGDPKKDLIGVHNGSLKEPYSLCSKRDMKFSDYEVDSKALFAILANEGLDVLSEYKGDAVLVWTNPIKPDEMYVFKGASKAVSSGPLLEERPLFFLETEEGIYFSSMENSLLAISEEKEEVKRLNYNRVFRVKNGKFVKEVKAVDRENVNLYTYSSNKGRNYPINVAYNEGYDNWEDEWRDYYGNSRVMSHRNNKNNCCNKLSIGKSKKEEETITLEKALDIDKETLPFRATKLYEKRGGLKEQAIYYHKNRFHYNGKLLSGCVFTNKHGIISSIEIQDFKPVYFLDGVMLKGKQDYERVLDMKTRGIRMYSNLPGNNFALSMSEYSMYPITNVNSYNYPVKGIGELKYYYSGSQVSSNKMCITPRFSNRNYQIKDGYLFMIKSTVDEEKGKQLIESESTSALQQKLNFEEDNKGKVFAGGFDTVFTFINEAWSDLTKEEIVALRQFLEDKLKLDNTLDPDYEEVTAEIDRVIRNAVKNKNTIREEIGDHHSQLDSYLAIVEELMEEKLIDHNKDNKEHEDDLPPKDNDVDKLIENFEKNKNEEEIDGKLSDAIHLMSELKGEAEILETYSDNELATTTGNAINSGLDNLRSRLNEIFDEYKKTSLNLELTRL